ncbi:DUF6461 domain-containing protein [Dactylosporangium sp. NPDC050588]|uniref:DUF6461 domain-containing protein n=1 Tax=Dactylosporangium sp. NPDC050588 TaxID=3157211 RepID=UPI0033DEE17D
MSDELAGSYLDVIGGENEWFGVAGCWTVVQPAASDAVDIDRVVRRLGCDPVGLVTRAPSRAWEVETGGDELVFLVQTGPAVSMIEVGGYQGTRDVVLSRLSEAATVHSACWNVLGKRYLAYAAHGEVVTYLHSHFPDRLTGADPAALDEDLRNLLTLGEVIRNSASDDLADGDDWLAEMLAVVERRTGVRLSPDQLYEQHPSIVLRPLPDEGR